MKLKLDLLATDDPNVDQGIVCSLSLTSAEMHALAAGLADLAKRTDAVNSVGKQLTFGKLQFVREEQQLVTLAPKIVVAK